MGGDETYCSSARRLGFGQSQTLRSQKAMFTSWRITLTIQGCFSISLGIGREFGSRARLKGAQSSMHPLKHCTTYANFIKSFISGLYEIPSSSSSSGG